MFKLTKTGQIITVAEKIQSEIQESGISIIELIAHFRESVCQSVKFADTTGSCVSVKFATGSCTTTWAHVRV